MKYTLLLAVSLLLTSCGSSFLANKVEKNFKGDWVLQSITFPDSSGFFDVDLYTVASVSCFQNSTWKFVPNNSTGEFVLEGSDCPASKQNFTWFVDPQTAKNTYPEMLLKMTTGQKAREVTKGVRIRIKSLLADEMVWEQSAIFSGEEITIEMTFSKL